MHIQNKVAFNQIIYNCHRENLGPHFILAGVELIGGSLLQLEKQQGQSKLVGGVKNGDVICLWKKRSKNGIDESNAVGHGQEEKLLFLNWPISLMNVTNKFMLLATTTTVSVSTENGVELI